MKECWFKAIEGWKPCKGTCMGQMTKGCCETCRYYRESEQTENENAQEAQNEN